jgi:hypothetical protein
MSDLSCTKGRTNLVEITIQVRLGFRSLFAKYLSQTEAAQQIVTKSIVIILMNLLKLTVAVKSNIGNDINSKNTFINLISAS